MRVLVTGGAGFIGSHVADGLLAEGHQVAVVDNLATGKRENVPAGATFWEEDIRDKAKIDGVFAQFKPEVVCHQAAQSSVAISVREPILDAEINILGTINLLRACVAHETGRIVFASTGGAIYGEAPKGGRANLRTRPKPVSPYAMSKLAGEGYLELFRRDYGLPYNVLRYSNVYGPRQDPHGEAGVVAIFAGRLLRHEPITVNAMARLGDDGCVRDYVYIEDVVRANLKAIDGKIARNVINVCTGVGTSTAEIAKSMKAAANSRSELLHGAHRRGDLKRSVLEPDHEAPPQVPFAEGLKRTTAWFQAKLAS
jgi:UDP-glucose 4-epimerase